MRRANNTAKQRALLQVLRFQVLVDIIAYCTAFRGKGVKVLIASW